MSVISRHKPPDARLERKICIACIVSDDYLRQIKEIYRQDSLRLRFTKSITDWCLEYYDQYKKAPSRHIEDIFHFKTKLNFQQETADEISEFLTSISEEYSTADKINVEYLLRQTEEHFRLVSLDVLRVSLNKAIIAGNIEEGEALTKGYQRPVRQQTTGVDIFRDIDPILNTFGERAASRTILTFPGEFGRIVGPLEREQLVCYVGNTGIGKSWFLLQSAWWAVMAGHDVLYVSFEMSEAQITARTYQWATGLPKRGGNVYLPQWDCGNNQSGICPQSAKRIGTKSLISPSGGFYTADNYPKEYQPCDVCRTANDHTLFSYDPATYFKIKKRKALDLTKAMKSRNLFYNKNKRAGKMIFVRWPARSKSVDDLRLYMQNLWEYENIEPSLLISDYANKMRPSVSNREKRWNIDDVFVESKAIAQERSILHITAHQGNTVRDGKDLKRGNWQEGISGLNECDLSFMINQKEKEKDQGLYRLLIGKKRDDEYSATGQLYITSCLNIGRPYLDSWWSIGGGS